MISVQIKINEKLFSRDPEATKLGKNILDGSIKLIDEIGFEQFNFKKLAQEISSTEASIYRYFDNKHKLLIYLISWYWSWLSFRLSYETHRIQDAKECLEIAIQLFSHTIESLPQSIDKDIEALKRIVISESPKAYLTKDVDEVNKEGAFLSYKQFCREVATFVTDLNPNYEFPRTLISTAIEGAHNQQYFADHLPSLTEIPKDSKMEIERFLQEMIFKAIS